MPPASPEPVRILGIDPGSHTTGYGVIEERGGKLVLLACGALSPGANLPLAERLAGIFTGLEQVLREHSPGEVAVESLFYARNARSALLLGHARGVALLAAQRFDCRLFEYAPQEVKKAVVGTGRAEKDQVARMVELLLGRRETIRPTDATDALAVAICHAHGRRLRHLTAARPAGVVPVRGLA